MADLARLYDFISGQPIASAEVDAELNQLVAGHNAQEDALEVLGTWRTLLARAGTLAAGSGAGTWVFVAAGIGDVDLSLDPAALYFDPDDYAITNKSLRLRVRAQTFTNGIAPASNFTFKLFQVATSGGGAGVNTFTFTAVAGTDALIAAPAVNTRSQAAGAAVASPGASYLALGVLLSSNIPASSRTVVNAQLQLRHV